jgi:hypothetical protein
MFADGELQCVARRVAREAGAELEYVPILLGALFKR